VEADFGFREKSERTVEPSPGLRSAVSGLLERCAIPYAARVRVYTKYRVRKRGEAKPSRVGAICLVLIFLLGGVAWLTWKRGYFSKSEQTKISSAASNVPAAATNSRLPPTALTLVRQSNAPALEATATKTGAVLDAQIALDRIGISSGSIDGVLGSQTRAALRAFQLRESLSQTGELDPPTSGKLPAIGSAVTNYRVGEEDVKRLLPLAHTWLGKSEQPRLDFESLVELIAEKNHAHPNLLRRLNAGINWSNVAVGAEVLVPTVQREPPASKAAFLQIRLGDRILQAFDSANRLIAHFPCSIAQRMEKRPVGELRVAVVAPNPNYTFDPEVFPESTEARELGRKLVLPPGPNNPVGAVWIGLDRPGYGIHGTPKPEDVGRTESHGCFRLANWNAEYLLQLVTVGTSVRVEE